MQLIDYTLIVFAYLLGSIPTAVWVGRWFYQIDIREHGSKNAGATNVMRVLGAKAGIPVLIFDLFKGWIAVWFTTYSSIPQGNDFFISFQIFVGVAAILGHIFPIFAQFRGGKGVATVAGVVLAISTIPTLIAIGVFVLVLLATKYVSVGSMMGGISFPLTTFIFIPSPFLSMKIFSISVAIMLITTHTKNIKRLINREEKKAGFLVKKTK